ncbi:MAG: hypothetical protein ABJO09_18095 [Hyphomicrobiales bacterium]
MVPSLSNPKSMMFDILPRFLLGGIFLLGAIDGFAFILFGDHIIHPPTSVEGLALETALKEVGFFWPLMKSVELVGALLLLTNRAPALGLAILAPIMAVIVCFHAALNPSGLPLAAILIVTGGLVLWTQRNRYADLFLPDAPTKQTQAVPTTT